MIKINVSEEVLERLQEIALKSNMMISDVIKSLLDFHENDNVIIDNLKDDD